MAWFRRDKTEEKESVTPEKKEKTQETGNAAGNKKQQPVAAAKPARAQRDTVSTTAVNLSRILTQPRITEKATFGIERGVYVFNVAPDVNKTQVRDAVQQVYGVKPVKVHMTVITSKNVRNTRTGKKGVKSGGKKAYVYLKKGDTISIM